MKIKVQYEKLVNWLIIPTWLLSMLLAGCTTPQKTTEPADGENQPSSQGGELQSGEGKTVGLSIAMLAGSAFWQVLADELDKGFTELGYKFVVYDGQGDVSKQTSDIEDMISQQFAMILINPYDSKAIVPVTLRAKEAGIPVIAVDIDIDTSGYSEATCIADNFTIGYNLGWYAGGLFDTPDVRIILISGYPGGIDSYQRRMGFLEGINAYQLEKFNQTGARVVYHGWGDYAMEPANKTMEDALIRIGTDFDILYGENDAMAMGGLQAMEEAGITDKVIIGVDGWRQFYELIKSGDVTATGLNSPTELAALTVQRVHEFLNGIKIPLWNYTTPAVVDEKNVDQYYDPDSVF
jgi:ribose transport system substrate-binding protein